jgi:hypothetical protein
LFPSAGYESISVFWGKILCYLHVNKIYCCLVHFRRKLAWTLLIF